MSDVAPETPAAPAPEAPAAPAPETPAAPAPESGSTRDSYTRSEYEEVQREAKNLRDRYAPYRDTFDAYEEPDREAWLWLAKTYKDDPKAAAEAMQQLSQAILTENQERVQAGEKPLTKAEVDAMLAERDTQSQFQAEVAKVEAKADSLGYKADSLERAEFFWIAQNETNGDLDKAHTALQARRQAVIDEYVENKRREASGLTRVPAAGGSTPGEKPDGPKTFEDSRKALNERLRQIAGQ